MIRQGQAPHETITLDELDRRIVQLLRPNSRRTYVSIAPHVGVSEPTVRNRVERMIEAGILMPLTRVNEAMLGFSVHAMVGIRVARGRAEAVGARLAEMESVASVVHTTGRFDLIIEAHLRGNEELYKFLNEDLAQVTGIVHTETWHVLRTQKLSDEWAAESVGQPPLDKPKSLPEVSDSPQERVGI